MAYGLKEKQLNYLEIAIIVFLFICYGFFLAHQINLTTADLGRHLKNGELIVQGFLSQPKLTFFRDFPLLHQNFYSYTEENFSVINHHWLAGVIFFLVFRAAGFIGLHLFFIVLSLIAFWLFFNIAKKEIGLGPSAILSLLIIPLIAERSEIRPEVFSYLFSGLFFTFLWHYRQGEISYRWLLVLPLLEVSWVNLHIYFFLGPLIIGVFLLESLLLDSRRKQDFLRLGAVFLLTVFTTVINPSGLKGALIILTIFQNYGYRLVENQPLFFLERLMIKNPNFFVFKTVFLVLVASFIPVIKFGWRKLSPANLIFAFGFCLAAWLAIRNFTVFGLFALPLIAANLKAALGKIGPVLEKKADFFGVKDFLLPLGFSFIFLLLLFINYPRLTCCSFGLGILKETDGAAEFFKANNIYGPIFNNYDIGGYLIFHLFPKVRVFVDNRPEAYPLNFFNDVYISGQEDENEWKKIDEQYRFNAIFFSLKDITPWGQKFLIARINDSDFSPVFADQDSIIFVRNSSANQPIIEKYEIPKGNFRVIKNE